MINRNVAGNSEAEKEPSKFPYITPPNNHKFGKAIDILAFFLVYIPISYIGLLILYTLFTKPHDFIGKNVWETLKISFAAFIILSLCIIFNAKIADDIIKYLRKKLDEERKSD